MPVVAHFFTYRTHVKRRWIGLPFIDVLLSEFRMRNREYYLEAIKKGAITVNSKIVENSYILAEQDVINHTVHIHEPATPEIEIIREEGDYSVINKPAGIPVHPTGGYYNYSVTRSLYPDRKVGCVNRLDLPVSGILILVFKNHAAVHSLLKTATKKYVAKVCGVFPEFIEVDMPIITIEGREHKVSQDGKPSRTIFRRLKYLNGHSIVECQPITGRTHQIRLHLKHIGFPIVNDILYNSDYSIKPEKKVPVGCNTDISGFEEKEKYEFVIRQCEAEKSRTFKVKDSFICLHAWKYEFNGIIYEAKWPEWTKL